MAKTVTITEGGSEISPYEYIKKANLNERQSPIVPKKCKLSIKSKTRKKSKEIKEIKDTRLPLPMPDKIENSVRTPSTVTDEKQYSGTDKERDKYHLKLTDIDPKNYKIKAQVSPSR